MSTARAEALKDSLAILFGLREQAEAELERKPEEPATEDDAKRTGDYEPPIDPEFVRCRIGAIDSLLSSMQTQEDVRAQYRHLEKLCQDAHNNWAKARKAQIDAAGLVNELYGREIIRVMERVPATAAPPS